jgi:hypothetical protein
MSICSGSIVPRIAFRMESFVCRRQRSRYREPKSCSGDDPARQSRSELQAARGLRRCAAQKRRTTAFVLSLRDYLGRAESFGLVPLLGVRRGCTGAHRSRSARFRLRPILQAGSLPARPTLSVAPAGRKPGESGQEIQEEAPRFAKKGPARGCSGNTSSLYSRVCMKRPTQNRP